MFMIKKSDKNGSHVGVMISFVIFVTFLIFVYAVLEPAINAQKGKESFSNFLELEITDKVSYDMTAGTVDLVNPLGPSCVKLSSGRTALGIGTNIITKEYSGTSLASYVSSSNANDLIIQGTSTSDNFLKIYYSPAFDSIETSASSCTVLNEGSGYNVGVTKTQKYIFEEKMIELIRNYDNYEDLRAELKIPEGIEFGYGITLSNGTSIETEREESSTDVYIKESPIQYVDAEGNILIGYLKIKVW
jgi:hypothetical protein